MSLASGHGERLPLETLHLWDVRTEMHCDRFERDFSVFPGATPATLPRCMPEKWFSPNSWIGFILSDFVAVSPVTTATTRYLPSLVGSNFWRWLSLKLLFARVWPTLKSVSGHTATNSTIWDFAPQWHIALWPMLIEKETGVSMPTWLKD